MAKSLKTCIICSSGKGWWSLKVEENIKLGCTLISGHPSVTADRNYVLPVRSKSSLSHAELQEITQTVQEDYKSGRCVCVCVCQPKCLLHYPIYKV